MIGKILSLITGAILGFILGTMFGRKLIQIAVDFIIGKVGVWSYFHFF